MKKSGMARRASPRNGISPSRLRWIVATLLVFITVGGLSLFWLSDLGSRKSPPSIPRKLTSNSTHDSSAEAPVLPTSNISEEGIRLLSQGTRLLEDGKTEEAIKSFREGLQLSPGDEDLHYNLAFALARINQIAAAKKEYLEALRIYPDYSEAHINLGNLLASEKKFSEALEHYEAAALISPENPSIQNNIGSVLGRQSRTEEAVRRFLEAVRLNPSYVEARFNLANAYLIQGRKREAAEQFSKVVALQPDFEPARRALELLNPEASRARKK